MFTKGDMVIYGTEGICIITDITEKQFGTEVIEYFVLEPISKKENVIFVPQNNEMLLKRMRHILKEGEAKLLVDEIDVEPMDWVCNDRERQRFFKETVLYGNTQTLISMAKSLHIKQEEQIEKGKKLHASDERFLRDIERMIIEELSLVLKISQGMAYSMVLQKMKS